MRLLEVTGFPHSPRKVAFASLIGTTRGAALKPPFRGHLLGKVKGATFGGSPMRIILALALLGASLSLSGCFHHNQAVYAEPLPPPAHPPIK